MKGRGRGQLSVFHKAGTLHLHQSTTLATPPTIASVTYDDPWESWEPGAAWGNGAGGGRSATAPSTQAGQEQPKQLKSDQALRWDEDSDTNLRNPKQLPRTLITMSELDWEDSEECATELWQHPQRRVSRESAAQRSRTQVPGPGSMRTTASLRPEPRVTQTGPRPTASHTTQRSAEPTARWKTGISPRAPQRLPAAPPPRAAELEPERRERTITQSGPGQSAAAASQLPPPPPLSAARVSAQAPRSLMQTQVSGFGTAPRSPTPAPGSLPRYMPAQAAPIESLRDKLEATHRILPPPPRPPGSGHIPTILGTPTATGGVAPSSRAQPLAAGFAHGHGPASTSVQAAAIEHLQEQLLEAMARARVQEARAAEAEKSVEEVEEQIEAILRTQLAEAEQLREQLKHASDQLRVSDHRALEAERRSLAVARPSNMLHLADAELAPRAHKQSRANLILSGLLASSLSFGGAAYFMFYAPLQKQLVVLDQQRMQDAQAQANALTNVKAQSAAERQGFEAQSAELRSQLEAARAAAVAANTVEEPRRGGRSRRASSADAAEDAPSGTRSARAIERRMRRARGAAAADDRAEPAAPARSNRSSAPSRDSGNDPLDGI